MKSFSLFFFQKNTAYLLFLLIFLFVYAFSQEQLEPKIEKKSNEELPAPEKVNVKPKVYDEEISQRLKNILEATNWFLEPKVYVQDGIVFLYGKTFDQKYKQWAKDLASRTEDSVAVVNHIQVIDPPLWDFTPFIAGLYEQLRGLLRKLPSILFGLIILLFTLLAAKAITSVTRLFMQHHIENRLLLRVLTWGIGLGIILIGLYSIFNLMGLTAIALTVIGGTGLLGIILGIAFKEITENLLASIFLSINNPFHKGDLIEIEGVTGYVQSLTIRSTILISLEGNYVQIPNATVYKSKIRNYTSNPNRREDFIVGIGYDCAISDAQKIALEVLKEHAAVLKNPEPWVLVDNLDKSTISLRIYFWLDGEKHHWLKVRSSVIRLVKRAFQREGIPIPDPERELIFPEGIAVRLVEDSPTLAMGVLPIQEENKEATKGEGQLQSEATNIQAQSLHSQQPEKGGNLLKDST